MRVALAFLLITAVVFAARVEIDVAERLQGTFVFTNYSVYGNILNASTEFYNTGSVAYKARLRLDLYESGKLSSVWSDERPLAPGIREGFFLYWLSNRTNATAQLRAYFGNEILADNATELLFEPINTSDAFEISNIRTSENRIEFDLKGMASAKAVIAPVKYTDGWIFEEVVTELSSEPKRVTLPYFATVWSPETVTVAVFSKDGLFYTEKAIKLEKASNAIIDLILAVFSPFFIFR